MNPLKHWASRSSWAPISRAHQVDGRRRTSTKRWLASAWCDAVALLPFGPLPVGALRPSAAHAGGGSGAPPARPPWRRGEHQLACPRRPHFDQFRSGVQPATLKLHELQLVLEDALRPLRDACVLESGAPGRGVAAGVVVRNPSTSPGLGGSGREGAHVQTEGHRTGQRRRGPIGRRAVAPREPKQGANADTAPGAQSPQGPTPTSERRLGLPSPPPGLAAPEY